MSDNRYRARISLGKYATQDERDAVVNQAYAKLGTQGTQEAPQRIEVPDRVSIPANVNLVLIKPLTLDLETWLYASDFHCPLHNRTWIKRLIAVGQTRMVTHLVIGGDFFDMDSSSRHPKTEKQAGLNQTLRIGGDLLVALASVFERIYILPGNHCRRVATKLDEPLEFDSLIHAAVKGRIPASRIISTDFDYLFVGQEDSGWVVGHPRYFSTIPAKGGADVAMIQRRNVIGAHNHIQGLIKSRDGRFVSIDPGHMTEPTLTPYKMQSEGLSRYPAWSAGFVLIENNVPTLFGDGLVNWSEYGC